MGFISKSSLYRHSRYVFLFKRDGDFFLYNSRTNSFYSLSEDIFKSLGGESEISDLDEEGISQLRAKKILTTLEEDNRYRDFLKLKCLRSNYGCHELSLTILPTVSCNLRCPYCFEQEKPSGIMTEEMADRIVDFIKSRATNGKYSITWFGGEPLLGLAAMDRILTKLDGMDGLKRTDHSIITNGTLLNKQASELFGRFPLDSMQVTLDGDRGSHDKKRFFQSGEGTFDIIMKNVSEFLEADPACRVTFRINVDNRNKEEYISLREKLMERFKEYRVSVYPGILRANKGCEDETFFTSSQHLEFSTELWKKGLESLYPSHLSKGCCATRMSSHVIGPKGELYLCWEHAGDPAKIIGNIDGSPGACTDRYPTYMLRGTCFDDPRCKECGLLPICSGGCPDKRVANLCDGTNHDLCSIYNGANGKGLEDALFTYYKLTKATSEK